MGNAAFSRASSRCRRSTTNGRGSSRRRCRSSTPSKLQVATQRPKSASSCSGCPANSDSTSAATGRRVNPRARTPYGFHVGRRSASRAKTNVGRATLPPYSKNVPGFGRKNHRHVVGNRQLRIVAHVGTRRVSQIQGGRGRGRSQSSSDQSPRGPIIFPYMKKQEETPSSSFFFIYAIMKEKEKKYLKKSKKPKVAEAPLRV